jgi:hypothetical protein
MDVAAQDFRSVRYVCLKVPRTSRALRQRGGASEGALAIVMIARVIPSSPSEPVPAPAAMSAAIEIAERGSLKSEKASQAMVCGRSAYPSAISASAFGRSATAA